MSSRHDEAMAAFLRNGGSIADDVFNNSPDGLNLSSLKIGIKNDDSIDDADADEAQDDHESNSPCNDIDSNDPELVGEWYPSYSPAYATYSGGPTTPANPTTVYPQPNVRLKKTKWKCRATQTEIRWDRVEDGEPLSISITFQNYKTIGESMWKHRIGRIAVVDTAGETVVDAYLAYEDEDEVIKYCSFKQASVEPPDFLFKNGAVEARQFEGELKELLKDRTVFVHDSVSYWFYYGESEDALLPSNGVTVYDTRTSSILQNLIAHPDSLVGQPGLAYAGEVVLGKNIQQGGIHTPVEDAKTTMELYLLKHPYDRVAEAAKLGPKKSHTQPARCGGRFVQKSIAQQEPTLGDFIKVKMTQGKAKRAKASATALGK
ncbi:hypothetical protein M409DRAFT_16709 [Zasmidium cellare ATCC 36951]|uniref:Exonuclease domain-containing protein n=1 Tax=Zasmidium cellare ATCC 36951 TaxID=1080233 RepID=A0A6A6D516_ZASCE|nr:uncharacterized protein M409DRAFT_16709 [Zasmidium cellare ATCC 36951]KAF2172746.1 hypothetical protein M409DRAFT_16709 [Zasmidium cellare ATCC 36951]